MTDEEQKKLSALSDPELLEIAKKRPVGRPAGGEESLNCPVSSMITHGEFKAMEIRRGKLPRSTWIRKAIREKLKP